MPSTAARNPIYLLFPGEVSHSSVTCSNPVMQWVVNACVCVCLSPGYGVIMACMVL